MGKDRENGEDKRQAEETRSTSGRWRRGEEKRRAGGRGARYEAAAADGVDGRVVAAISTE